MRSSSDSYLLIAISPHAAIEEVDEEVELFSGSVFEIRNSDKLAEIDEFLGQGGAILAMMARENEKKRRVILGEVSDNCKSVKGVEKRRLGTCFSTLSDSQGHTSSGRENERRLRSEERIRQVDGTAAPAHSFDSQSFVGEKRPVGTDTVAANEDILPSDTRRCGSVRDNETIRIPSTHSPLPAACTELSVVAERGPALDQGTVNSKGISSLSDPSALQQKKPTGFIPHRVLQDVTNSPKKSRLSYFARKDPDVVGDEDKSGSEKPQSNAKFFHEDLIFAKNKNKKKKTVSSETKMVKKAYKKYLRVRDANTRFNRGYVTITPRRKAVVDICSIPMTFYSKGKGKRKVWFDLSGASAQPHNTSLYIKPILDESRIPSEFVWDKEKEVVDIIRRVDIGSEISTEDFVFKRVGSSVGM